jgi:hypothetical protein
MSESAQARPQRPPALIYKVVNPTLKVLLYSPLHGLMSKRLMVLNFQGRKSGKPYSIVVGYHADGDTVLVTTQARWAKNLVGGVPVNLRLRGRKRSGTAQLLTDIDAMSAAYATLLSGAPELGQFIGVSLDSAGKPVAAEVADARQRGYVVISIALSPVV